MADSETIREMCDLDAIEEAMDAKDMPILITSLRMVCGRLDECRSMRNLLIRRLASAAPPSDSPSVKTKVNP